VASGLLQSAVVLALLVASGASGAAQPNCQVAINEFRDIVNTETSMGHVTGARQANAMAELNRIEQVCRAGRHAEALTALQALQRRMGFR
jgi:acetaldehyde dehydrogenase (acetylating)